MAANGRLLLAILLMSGLTAASAQTLTWEDCRQEVARNNPELRSAREAVEQAQAQYRARWGVFLPSVQAGAGYDWSGRDSETSESGSWRASASQNLFSGFRDSARVRAAAAAVEAAQCRLERRRADISHELAQAFAALLFAQDWVALSAQIHERRLENLRLVDLRFQEGREHKGSLLRSQALARQSDFEAAKAGRDLRVARENLAKAMGWPGASTLVVTGDWTLLPAAPQSNVLDLVEATPEHRLAQADRRQAQANLAVARSDDYPSLDLNGSFGRSGSGWPPDQDQWGVGVSLSWALFRGGQTWNTVSAAQAAERGAQADAAATDLAVRAALEQALAALADAVENVEVQEQFLVAAEVRAQIARSQYSNGLLSFQDWDTIENDLMDKQKAVLQSRRAALLARAGWLRTQGLSALP
jgi:outer membrane protein TolC